MKEKRMLEITKKVLVGLYKKLGTERFMGFLKGVAEDARIPDQEMYEFFRVIENQMGKRTRMPWPQRLSCFKGGLCEPTNKPKGYCDGCGG